MTAGSHPGGGQRRRAARGDSRELKEENAMGSPITLSGFNNIDFNLVLNAIMQQERRPVQALETQKKALEAQKTAFGTFAARLGALGSAAESLRAPAALDGTTVTVSDPGRLAISGAAAPPGTYEIVVQELARAQVTTTVGGVPDRDSTIVASGGTLTIGGVAVAVNGDLTLDGLVAAINGTSGLAVNASIVRNATGFQLVLTGRDTGAAHTFSLQNALAGGHGIAFASTNAQEATDAQVLVNGITATSATNRFDGVIAGLSFTALRKDVTEAVTITITASSDSIKALVQTLVEAFNAVTKFVGEQAQASGTGAANGIGRDPLVRGLRRELASVLSAAYPGGGPHGSLAELGFEFTRSGDLTFNAAAFDAAVAANKDGVRALFRGQDGSGGAFGSLHSAIQRYTAAGGLVLNATQRIDSQVQAVTTRISDLEARLAVRREALQREFIAADMAIAQLNQAQSQLGSLGGQYRLL
jgi:flagellar hook-associated protein 2